MRKRLTAYLTAVCLLLTLVAPVSGTFAADQINALPTSAKEINTIYEDTGDEPTAAPAPEAPATQAPAPEAPVTEAPVTEAPTAAPTAEPTAAPTAEPTAAPTAEPTAAPTAEPTAEPTAAPTVEPTAEPTAAPVKELGINVATNKTFAFANEDKIAINVTVFGGVAPYGITLKVNGKEAQSKTDIAAEGDYKFTYAPTELGTHKFRVEVTDAQGSVATREFEVSVAIRDGEEKQSDWEKTMRGVKLTGDWRVDIIEIAKTQLGYKESETNFVISDDGVKQGYTRYGAWYGSAYAEWCGMFVSFCLNYAGVSNVAFPYEANCANWKEKLQQLGAYEDNEDEYTPKAGDLIFISRQPGADATDKDSNKPAHVGIVESVTDSKIYTIEGNRQKSVCRYEYDRADAVIVGYANTTKLMKMANALPDPEVEPVPVIIPEIGEDGAVGHTNTDNVNVRCDATTASNCMTYIPDAGTEVLVLSASKVEGWVWYYVQYGNYNGYVRSDLITLELKEDLIPDQPEDDKNVGFTPWQAGVTETALSYSINGAVSYSWQRGAANESGELVWEEIASTETGAALIPTLFEDLKYSYRCVAAKADGTQAESAIFTLIDSELVKWLNEGGVSEEMLTRAMNAKSLESMVIENDALVYVRDGKVYATYDAASGYLVDSKTGKVVAYVDMATGMIYPVDSEASDAE